MAGKRIKTRRIGLVVTPEDYDLLSAQFAVSSRRSFSAFCRDLLFSKPLLVKYHNVSADEFLVVALEVKKELDDVISTARAYISSSGSLPEHELATLIEKVDELKLVMHQIYIQWSSV